VGSTELRQSQLKLTPPHFIKQCHQRARPAGANGMAQREGAALDVRLAEVGSRSADHRQGLCRKGSGELDPFDVLELQIRVMRVCV